MALDTCRVCDKEWGCLFSCLSGDALTAFRKGSYFRQYKRGQLIHFQGDEPTFVFCIQYGSFKLYRTNEYNHEVVTRVLGKCEFVGIQPIFAGELIGNSAEALEDSELCITPKAVFMEILNKTPDLQGDMLKHTAREWGKSEALWLTHAKCSAEDRVEAVLSQLVHPLSGYPKGRKGTVTITMSRTEIARVAGITPPTLSRILRGFAERGMITLHPRTIDVLNIRER